MITVCKCKNTKKCNAYGFTVCNYSFCNDFARIAIMYFRIILKPSEFFLTEDKKGAMRARLKTPIMRYGYVLYINEKIKTKL